MINLEGYDIPRNITKEELLKYLKKSLNPIFNDNEISSVENSLKDDLDIPYEYEDSRIKTYLYYKQLYINSYLSGYGQDYLYSVEGVDISDSFYKEMNILLYNKLLDRYSVQKILEMEEIIDYNYEWELEDEDEVKEYKDYKDKICREHII